MCMCVCVCVYICTYISKHILLHHTQTHTHQTLRGSRAQVSEVREVRGDGKSDLELGEGLGSKVPNPRCQPPCACHTHSSFHFHTSRRKSSRLSWCLLTPRSFHSCFSTTAFEIRGQTVNQVSLGVGISFTQ